MHGKQPFLPIITPTLGEAEADAAKRVILSGWTTQGPEVKAFEGEFASYVGADHACAVSSCTTALHLALLALGVGPGDEVVSVSHSFIATANAIRYCGATPVFVDVSLDTFNVDASLVAAAIGPKTKAAIVVHQMGMPADLEALVPVFRDRNVPVVEDAACALGSDSLTGREWRRIGRPQGKIACFSFHPRKLLSTGDGGMLTTNDAKLDGSFRLLRHHGMSLSDSARHASPTVVFEEYPVLGYNYRLTDIQAAIGRVQLGRLDGVVKQRRAIAALYRERLADTELLAPTEPTYARSNWQSYCIMIPQWAQQRAVMQHLLDRGIASRRGIMCAHRTGAYPKGTWLCSGRAACAHESSSCPQLRNSEIAEDRGLLLPLSTTMTVADVDRVVDALRGALRERDVRP